jgi:Sulfatase-modifying factor enzyme 1
MIPAEGGPNFPCTETETTGAIGPTRCIHGARGTYLLCRRASYSRAPAPERPPSSRVLRGGSWNNNPQNLRSANRGGNRPDYRNNNVGFRVASTLCAGAIAITVAMGAHDKRSGPFMMTMVGARVEMGARYHGGACLGRLMGSGRRHRF